MSKTYEIVTESIIKQLESGVAPWRKPWRTEMPANLVSKKEYRGINIFLLASLGYGSRYWVTYRQAQTLGGSVRKGEHGSKVVFWKIDRISKGEQGNRRNRKSQIDSAALLHRLQPGAMRGNQVPRAHPRHRSPRAVRNNRQLHAESARLRAGFSGLLSAIHRYGGYAGAIGVRFCRGVLLHASFTN